MDNIQHIDKHKHAYLIMAHNNWSVLEKLVSLIDSPFNDIYLHIDRKSKDFDWIKLKSICNKSSVYLVKRTDIKWGNESQVKAELILFREAYSKGPYWMYHLLSGSDLPLKDTQAIYNFFEKNHKNFIRTDRSTPFEWRLKTYISIFRYGWIPVSLKKSLNKWSEIIQYKLGVNRITKLKQMFPSLGYGDNWCSITHEAVGAILDNRKKIKKFTRYTYCSDELYKQIILLNQSVEIIGPISNERIRLIDWSGGGGHPKVYTMKDFKTLSSGQYIFARKFDENIDLAIVDKIFNRLKK